MRFKVIPLLILILSYMPPAIGNGKDSLVIDKQIQELAEKTILVYKNPVPLDYLDKLFRLQLVAKKYDAALKTLNEACLLYDGDSIPRSTTGFPYQVYLETIIHKKNEDSFDSLFKTIFKSRLASFSEEQKISAAIFYNDKLEDIHQKFLAAIDGKELSENLSETDALSITRSYGSYLVFSKTMKLAKDLLTNFENERYIINDSIVLKMKDGGEVSLTVVRERKMNYPLPVVLMSNVYPGMDVDFCKQAVAKGYVGVIANTRGKRLSSSVFEPFVYDANDTYEVIDWIVSNEWCNGSVGMYGGSYLGFSQWAAVKNPHPALKTIVPMVAVAPGIDLPAYNGVFMNFSRQWAHFTEESKMNNYKALEDVGSVMYTNMKWYGSGISYRALDSIQGEPSRIFRQWLNRPLYDDYWKNTIPQEKEYRNINIPILTITGYYDDDQMGALHYLHEHYKWNPSANHYLLIGPYDHFGAQFKPSSTVSNYAVDSVALIHIEDIVFRWFDYVFKGFEKPIELLDRITFQEMGANKWLGAPSFSKIAMDTLTFYPDFESYHDTDLKIAYFASDKKQKEDLNIKHHKLITSKPALIRSFTQTVDLRDRSDSTYWKDAKLFGAFPLMVDSVLHVANDKMVFVSEPMKEPITIVGDLSISAILKTNKRDLDIVVDLFELMPDGKYMALNQNLQRASLADNPSVRNLLKPNEIDTIHFNNTFMTCKRLSKGSRIVIMMGVHKSPFWQINYGTGKDVSSETMKDAQENMRVEWFNGSSISIGTRK